jgi:WD40 repeat protein
MTWAFAPQGVKLATGTFRGKLVFRDSNTGESKLEVEIAQDKDQIGFGPYLTSIAYAKDGRTLATTHLDGTVRLWDPATGRELARLKGHEGIVNSVCFSPDGMWLVSGGDDNTLRLWEVATSKEIVKVTGHRAALSQVEFGPTGGTILSTGGTEVLLWELQAITPRKGDVSPRRD